MTLNLLKVHMQTFLSLPITQKSQILSCDTLVANERYSESACQGYQDRNHKGIKDHKAHITLSPTPRPSNSHVFNLGSCYSAIPPLRSTLHQNKRAGHMLRGNFGSSVAQDHKIRRFLWRIIQSSRSGYEWALQLGLVIECDTVCVCRACRTARLCNRTLMLISLRSTRGFPR